MSAIRSSWWLVRGIVRRVFRTPCDVCGDRRRCWRWHVEYFDCRVCGTEISEFDPKFAAVVEDLMPYLQPGRTVASREEWEAARNLTFSGSGTTYRLTWPPEDGAS